MMLRLSLIALSMIILNSCAAPRGFPPAGEIDNFDIVDSKVCRGAQPNHLALEWLAQRGVKTVINLRGDDAWTDEGTICRALGMEYFNLPMNGLMAPSQGAVEWALEIIGQSQGPVFIHCQFGADRTGTLVACYRIRHGMSNSDALNDAITHGLSDWLPGMHSFIRHFK